MTPCTIPVSFSLCLYDPSSSRVRRTFIWLFFISSALRFIFKWHSPIWLVSAALLKQLEILCPVAFHYKVVKKFFLLWTDMGVGYHWRTSTEKLSKVSLIVNVRFSQRGWWVHLLSSALSIFSELPEPLHCADGYLSLFSNLWVLVSIGNQRNTFFSFQIAWFDCSSWIETVSDEAPSARMTGTFFLANGVQ